jgi:diguanylate cyclase (GGDEF)-like protein
MHEFSVADWWKDKYNIPRSLSTPEFSGLVSIGIGKAVPEVFGEHEYKLVSMRFTGDWISAETLYISIIIGWLFILALEALSWFLRQQDRCRENTDRLSVLEVESEKYKELSSTDTLTGVANRSGFSKKLELISNDKECQLHCYALLVLDIDHFKHINDEHGHFMGDVVLKEFAERVAAFIRAEDFFARWGGEEFVILARLQSQGSEYVLAEKIRAKVEESAFGDQSIVVTVSIGVAVSKTGDTFDDLFKQADENLYTAKRKGRNQVVYRSRPAKLIGCS